MISLQNLDREFAFTRRRRPAADDARGAASASRSRTPASSTPPSASWPRPTSGPPSSRSSTASSRAWPRRSTCRRCTTSSATSSARCSTPRSSTSPSSTATTDTVRFPFLIERGVRFPEEVIPLVGFRRHVAETRQPLLVNERMAERREEFGQGGVQMQGEIPKAGLWVPLILRNEVFGVISLQNLDREGAFSESDVRAADDARREPQRRARERPAVRRDEAAPRRVRRARRAARDHRRHPAGPGGADRHPGDVRPRGRPAGRAVRRAGVRHRDPRPRRRTCSTSRTRSSAASASPDNPMAVHRPTPPRDGDAPAAGHQRARRRARGASWAQPAVRQGEAPKATLWAPLIVARRGGGRRVGPEPGPRAGVRRGRRHGSSSRSPRA